MHYTLSEEAGLREWIRANAPANTVSTYSTYAKQYLEFAARMGLRPQSQVALCAFMKDGLVRRKLARSTLVQVIPSVVESIFRCDAESPARDPKGAVLLGQTKRTISMLTEKSKPRKSILREHVRAMVEICLDDPQEVRDVFMLLLMFVGFLRESESVALLHTDVWVQDVPETGQEALYVVVRKSKTDQFSENTTIVIGGCPDHPLCRWHGIVCI